MNREEKLKEATELIEESVPSIMDVEEGCYLEHKKSGDYNIIIAYNDETFIYSVYSYYDDSIENYSEAEIWKEFKILGREIHLEDVIFANRIYTSCLTELYNNEKIIIGNYNVSKPFTNQSEEFYTF